MESEQEKQTNKFIHDLRCKMCLIIIYDISKKDYIKDVPDTILKKDELNTIIDCIAGSLYLNKLQTLILFGSDILMLIENDPIEKKIRVINRIIYDDYGFKIKKYKDDEYIMKLTEKFIFKDGKIAVNEEYLKKIKVH